jgi:hypothetical protein
MMVRHQNVGDLIDAQLLERLTNTPLPAIKENSTLPIAQDAYIDCAVVDKEVLAELSDWRHGL